MMNIGPMTKVSLILVTIICLGAFFLIDNNIPLQALQKEEQILEDYDDLGDFANAVRNGDEDLEEIPIQSMEAADIYDDADDNIKDCIDLAAEVGDSLTAREVVHCVDNVNYFENKYSSNITVPSNGITTSTAATDTDVDNAVDTSSTSDTSTDTSTSDDVTGNNLIDELVKTGKFTEDEAKEFASQNMLSGVDTTPTSDDTISDTSSDNTQATNTDDTTSSNNEENQDESSESNNKGNPEDYDSLTDLVDDIKNGVVDTDEISLSNFQNSGAYKGADQETQDCIDLAAKIGSNLIDYEIVRCSEDSNFFKNQIKNNADNNDNNNDESSDNNDNNNNNDPDDDAAAV